MNPITDSQIAYNAALRHASAAQARLDAASPLDPQQLESLAKSKGNAFESAVKKVQDHQQIRRDHAADAARALRDAASVASLQLGRPLSPHETAAGFDSYSQGAQPLHRWWLLSKTPCSQGSCNHSPPHQEAPSSPELPPSKRPRPASSAFWLPPHLPTPKAPSAPPPS